ncbi:Hypothetical predicted protein [Cloeon dipterum]|uniref:SH2 domain-containing protein n=1 Tax=Cloeon dipterum TaxID=197152 RepID=A0A8S1DU79_9INSE|nr:Hypothetical predicted protein [Cloeon dipterum]
MATSSSSTSSRRSDSLSSHSSDSGGDLRRAVTSRCPPLGLLSNKLHILSPISDKSQEPGAETSDTNRKSQRGPRRRRPPRCRWRRTSCRGTGDDVDVSIPLERQGWFHEAELRLHPEGSYLVRNSDQPQLRQ